MKQAISLILITLLIMVLPALSVAKTYGVDHHDDSSSSHVSAHHQHDRATHHTSQQCCHGHVQVLSLPVTFDQFRPTTHRTQHVTEYRFVVTTTSSFPEFRPPIS